MVCAMRYLPSSPHPPPGPTDLAPPTTPTTPATPRSNPSGLPMPSTASVYCASSGPPRRTCPPSSIETVAAHSMTLVHQISRHQPRCLPQRKVRLRRVRRGAPGCSVCRCCAVRATARGMYTLMLLFCYLQDAARTGTWCRTIQTECAYSTTAADGEEQFLNTSIKLHVTCPPPPSPFTRCVQATVSSGVGCSNVVGDTQAFHVFSLLFDGSAASNEAKTKFRFDFVDQPLAFAAGTSQSTTTGARVFACLCACVFICLWLCVHCACTFSRVDLYLRSCVCISECACLCNCYCVLSVHLCLRACTRSRVCTHMCTHRCVTCVRMGVCACLTFAFQAHFLAGKLAARQ
jgi:hypothetical protein